MYGGQFIGAPSGSDDLRGGGGDDNINGDDGDDFLFGDNGNDILDGGIGNDAMTGGAGNDEFIYRNDGNGFDRIKDFEDGVDGLRLFGFAMTFADVYGLSSDTATGLRIDFGSGNVLFIENFLKADFDSGDILAIG